MEKYIAIDNVCAWPNIKKLPNGEIIAVVFGQPCHLLWEGTIECWVSADNGRSWELRSNPVINAPETNRGNVAVGVKESGEIVVLCGGWDKAQPAPEKFVQGNINDDRIKYNQKDKTTLWPVCSLSKDNGFTWETQDIKVEDSDLPGWVPYGDIINLENGNIGCSMYGSTRTAYSQQGKKYGSFFLESEDNGMSWRCCGIITDDGNETALVRLPDGKLLAAVRKQYLDVFESTDNGRNWQHVSFVTSRGQYPGSFTILDDGNLLLTYGIRNNGLYGVGGMLMHIETESWCGPMVLTDFGNAWDGGYPSSLQLENSDIVTAYYAGPGPQHNRYHMGVIIWNMEERKLLNRCPEK